MANNETEPRKEPDTLEQISLAELKRDLKKQIAATQEHLKYLEEVLRQLEEQGSSLQKMATYSTMIKEEL